MFSKLFSGKDEVSTVQWNNIATLGDLEDLHKLSNETPVLIFKHSIRCSISSTALKRFEREFEEPADFKPYFIDLISYREISDAISLKYGIVHQSPQILLIVEGNCIYSSSHNGINYQEINEKAKEHV
ncbi:MAG: bacillithiol system redox-active protein YtxJ [Ekhidna sp.]|nr:bacillithiol system redox-active protein YtxJ [Ekhidna sp.]MBC6411192.1 bacillithiol system redox-active protein YtxJ [Ekhidna sp.]MBC6427002.1 bacillithiol system redox-active protein YtxJ [Ekhidna sp.]